MAEFSYLKNIINGYFVLFFIQIYSIFLKKNMQLFLLLDNEVSFKFENRISYEINLFLALLYVTIFKI